LESTPYRFIRLTINFHFRRILCRQSFRLAAELEPLDATSERHLLTDPRHGLLAILLERRRLLRAGQSTQSCSELSNSAYSPGSLAILTDSSSLVSEAPGDLTSMVKNVPVRRRHASDPGPTMDHHAADTPADRLVRAIARETLVELRSVSDQILELTVVYLKNAALDVIDSSVDEVKTVLSTRL
jgi:hypothetical protein